MNPCNHKVNSFTFIIRAAGSWFDGSVNHNWTFNYWSYDVLEHQLHPEISQMQEFSIRELACVKAFDVAVDKSSKNCVASAFNYTNDQNFLRATVTGQCAKCSLYGKIKKYTIDGRYSNNLGFIGQIDPTNSSAVSAFVSDEMEYTFPYAVNNEYTRRGLWLTGTQSFKLNIPSLSIQKTSQFCKDNQSNKHIFNLSFGPDSLPLSIIFNSIETGATGVMTSEGHPVYGFAWIEELTIT